MRKYQSGARTTATAAGRRAGKPSLFHSSKAAKRLVTRSTVIPGLRPGVRKQTGNTVIKLARTGKKNGAKSGVNQAISPGARSGLAASPKICPGEKTGAPRGPSIGTSGGDETRKAHKY
jgi:hypothetical protein